MGKADAPINCEENGLWPRPQPGSRAEQVKGKEDPDESRRICKAPY